MEKLSYEEFYAEVWDFVSERLVPNSFIELNTELVRAIMFDLWNIYDKSENISLKESIKISESIFSNYRKYGLKTPCEDDTVGWRNDAYIN